MNKLPKVGDVGSYKFWGKPYAKVRITEVSKSSVRGVLLEKHGSVEAGTELPVFWHYFHPLRAGEQLIDFIVSNKLFSIKVISPDACLTVWSSGAAEQLEAWLAEHCKEGEVQS